MNSINSERDDIYMFDVCHASELEIIQNPDWQYKNPDPNRRPERKDFGIGFYMCKIDDKTYPIGLKSGYPNVYLSEYTLDLSGLDILSLKVNLLWVMIVAAHRQRKSGSGDAKAKWMLLADVIRGEIAKYDMVIGPISNDRFYSVLDNFVDDVVAEDYTIKAINFMRYPMQYVSKSKTADKQIVFTAGRELSQDEIENANALWESEKAEMNTTMTELTEVEMENVENGIINGRLFSDIVNMCFKDGETGSDNAIKTRLTGIVKGWFKNGYC